VLERAGVNVQVADPGAFELLRQGSDVRRGLPAVDPGVAEPERVVVPRLAGRRAGVLDSQRDGVRADRHHQQQDQGQDDEAAPHERGVRPS
jgi:hypothetical protein